MAFTLDGHISAQNNNNPCLANLTTSNSGDRVVAQITYYRSSGLAGMTESVTLGGVAMTQRGAIHLDQSGERGLSIWWADAASPLSSAAIVANPSIASTTETSIVAFGAYNGGATIAWDANASLPAAANGTSGNPSVSGVSTTGANDLLLGFILTQGGNAVTAGSGFTLVASSETVPNTYSEYQAVSSTQSGISVGATVSSTAWVMVADALTTGGGANNASLAESFADFTLAGTVKVPAHANLAEGFADFTLAGTVKVPAHASLAESFADFTLAGAATAPAHASLAESFADFTLAGTVKVPAHANLAESFADFTLAGTAHVPGAGVHAALAEALADFTLAGAATVPAHADLAAILADIALAGSATAPAHASLADTLAAVTLAGAARAPAHAALAAAFAGFLLAGTASAPGGSAHAALAATVGDVLLSSSAHVAGPCITPRLMVRTAALGALAAAAASGDPCCAPLVGAQIFLGQTWPSQSPPPGSAAMPNQLLLYGWDEKSESVSGKTTNPKFSTVLTLVIEARVEVKAPPATALLPAQPSAAAIDAAVDGALDQLTFAVKKAICERLNLAVLALNNGRPAIEEIRRVDTASKYSETGQRMAGNGAVAFDLVYGEWFEPPILSFLEEAVILISPTAGAVANHGNAGNGAVGAVAVGLGAEPGDYLVSFSSSSSFAVTMPDGGPAGSGAVGARFAGGGLTFAILAGTAPFAAGDGFTVFVEVQAENYITFT